MQSFYPSHPENIYQFLASATPQSSHSILLTSENQRILFDAPITSTGSPTEQAIDILTDALAVHHFSEDSLVTYMRLHPDMSIDGAYTSYTAAKLNYSKLFEPQYIEPYATTPSQGFSIIPFENFEEYLLNHRDEIIANVQQVIQTNLYNNPPLPKTYQGEFMTVEQYFDSLHLTDLDKSFLSEYPILELTDSDEAIENYADYNIDIYYRDLDQWLISDDHTDNFQDLIDDGMLANGVDFYEAVRIAQFDRMRADLVGDRLKIQKAGLFQQFSHDYNIYALSQTTREVISNVVKNYSHLPGQELYQQVEKAMCEMVDDYLAYNDPPIKTGEQLKEWLQENPENMLGMSKDAVRKLATPDPALTTTPMDKPAQPVHKSMRR